MRVRWHQDAPTLCDSNTIYKHAIYEDFLRILLNSFLPKYLLFYVYSDGVLFIYLLFSVASRVTMIKIQIAVLFD